MNPRMRYRQFSIIRRRTDGQGAPDTALLAAIALLFVLGLFALASSSSYYSFTRFGSWYRVVLYQMAAGGIPGLLLFSLFFSVDYRRWQRWGVFWLVLTLGSLLLVFVPGLGEVRNGARSWVSLGPLTAQPAEAVKLTALIFLSGWLARIGFHDARSIGRGLVPFLAFTAAVLGLIALQPDLGTLLVVAVILATVYYVSGAQLLYVGSLAIVSLALLGMVLMSGGYRTQRLLVFMNPDLDPQGTGYHLRQAKLAIGSGGWFGRGLGKSYQKFAYLPEVSADSIFAIVAEEMGFFVAAGLIVLLAFIILRALRVARDAPDPFGRFLAVGIATWLGFQSFLNIAVMVGLAPLTGLPLPFISAGGSALAANLAAAGLLLNVSRHVPHAGGKRVQ